MNVYDFDKTIYRNDSTVDFYLWQLARHPLLIRFRPKQLLGFFLYYGIHAINKTEMKNYFYCYLKALKDVDSDVVSFWDSHMKGINKWYLEKHRDDDVVISASATFLVKEACSRLGIRNVICSEVDPYSGEVMGENCNGAQKPIRFREEGFRAEDIEEFYSDSYGDTPMALLAEKSFLVKGEKLIDWGSDK